MRKPLVVLLAAGVLAALSTTALAAGASVKVGDNYYVRSSGVPTVTVTKGSSVTWRFRGSAPHNVVVKSGPVKFRSPSKSSGSYRRTFTRRGTYVLYCTIHGLKDMSLTVKVR